VWLRVLISFWNIIIFGPNNLKKIKAVINKIEHMNDLKLKWRGLIGLQIRQFLALFKEI